MMDVEKVFAVLSEGGPRELSLDEVGEAIGLAFAEVTRVSALFDRLEQEGYTVALPTTVSLETLLMTVLREARNLRSRGEKPSLEALAQATAISPREVRVALLYGEVLSRGRAAGKPSSGR